MKSKSLLLSFFVLAGFLVVGFFSFQFGVFTGEQNILRTPPAYIDNINQDKPENIDFSVFWEVWRQVEAKFLDKSQINYQKMVYGAVNGMIESLGDPYTSFFNPQETTDFEEELSGKYEGVGMYVGVKDEQITVISPLKDSPAETAGIKPNDKIIKIDETFTADITIEQAVRLIKGSNGTTVTLLIQRDGWVEPKEFKLKRQVITIPTLEWEMLDTETALIKIYQFNQILTDEFNKAAVDILDKNAKSLIIDLRNNPGGYLEVAQNVAGWFLDRGEVVVSQVSNDPNDTQVYKSSGPGDLGKLPIVILINGGSASASEILAGALKDILGATLVGEQSFGKGSVQEQVFLSSGSSMKVTVAKWLTPNGNSIDKEGLTPDVEIEPSTEDSGDVNTDNKENDTQLQKAIEIVESLR